MDDRIRSLESQLDASASRIEALENRMVESDAGHLVVRLKAKYTAAREKLKAFKDAGAENWELYKADIWIAWYELENALGDVHEATLPEKG